jgi:hypothetical protein
MVAIIPQIWRMVPFLAEIQRKLIDYFKSKQKKNTATSVKINLKKKTGVFKSGFVKNVHAFCSK